MIWNRRAWSDPVPLGEGQSTTDRRSKTKGVMARDVEYRVTRLATCHAPL